MSNRVNKTFLFQRILEIQSEFLFNYGREAIRNWMALDFDEPWDHEGPSCEGLCKPKAKSVCSPHVPVALMSIPYLDWLGAELKIMLL